MEIWEMSKAEFFGHLVPEGHQDTWANFASLFSGLIGRGTPQPLPHATGILYEVADGNVVAYDPSSRELCGVASGDTIAVNGNYRGNRIGSGLVSISFRRNPWGPYTPRLVTIEGLRCLQRTHHLEVQQAIQSGLPVPPHVRADYGI
jgi:hypothetical protein